MKQKTLIIVKPHAFHLTKNIIEILEDRGLEISEQVDSDLTFQQALVHYQDLEGKDYYQSVAEMLSEGVCSFLLLEGENAISYVRTLIGETDPEKAQEGSIRHFVLTQYPNATIQYNGVHASDSEESFMKEYEYFKEIGIFE